MANRIDDFKAYFGAGARSNLFKVIFTHPAALSGAGATGEKLSFMVKAASLPGKSIAPIEVNFRGMKTKVAGDPTFNDWNVTFWNDVDFGAWKTMYAWSELCRTTLTNTSVDPSLYKAPIIVQQLDGLGNSVHTITLVGAFPSELGEVTLDSTAESTIEEFPVTFAYDYWTVTPNVA